MTLVTTNNVPTMSSDTIPSFTDKPGAVTTTASAFKIPVMSTAEVDATSYVRLRGFWRNAPHQWFLHADAIFANRRIRSDLSRVNHVLESLDEDGVWVISNVLGPDVKYNTVRNRLIATYSISPTTRFNTMFQSGGMGDRKPSQLLRDMRDLYPDDMSDSALQAFWQHKLPPAVRTVLAGLSGLSGCTLDNLAERADNIWEASLANELSSIAQNAQPTPATDSINQLDQVPQRPRDVTLTTDVRFRTIENAIHALTLQVASLATASATRLARAADDAPRTRQERARYHEHGWEIRKRDSVTITTDTARTCVNAATRAPIVPLQIKMCKAAVSSNIQHLAARPQPDSANSKIATPQIAAYLADQPRHRLFVNDTRTGRRFLIDSGAEILVIMRQSNIASTSSSEIRLTAANVTQIKTYGPIQLHLDLGFKRFFSWTFVMADVSRPIIGADFLHYYGLLIDIRHNRLVDLAVNYSVKITPATDANPVTICAVARPSKWSAILLDYPEVTRESPIPDKFLHDVVHELHTTGPPLFARSRRLPPDRLQIARKELDFMLQKGICRPSSSSWASPLLLFPKKDGTLRLPGEFFHPAQAELRLPELVATLRDFMAQLRYTPGSI